MRAKSQSRLSLDKAFMGFMLLGGFVFFSVTVFFTHDRVKLLQDDVLRSVVEIRGEHVAQDIGRHLEGHWDDLEALATVLPFSDRMTFRSFLTREVADGTHMVWAAYVNLQGDVLLASRQQREGENVSTENWFRAAQTGPGVAFDQTPDGQELLVMTVPIQPTSSTVAGYLTFQFQPRWFEDMIRDLAQSLMLDIVVFDSRGQSVLHSFEVDPVDKEQISVRNAMAGQKTISLETWPDLGDRYAVSIPELQTEHLPPMGWRMVVLTKTDQFDAVTTRLSVGLAQILGAVALILLVMSIGFIRIFLVPMHRLVENAQDMAEGSEDVFPIEDHRTMELSVLSSSLSRLQGRILRAEDRAAALQEALDKKTSGASD